MATAALEVLYPELTLCYYCSGMNHASRRFGFFYYWPFTGAVEGQRLA